MTPVVFENRFGWLHPAPGGRGVVLCPPYGYEALCTHRGWREIAETLAAAGIPTLRFDYSGTGDSDGDEDEPDRVAAWLASIVAAVKCLRAETGVQRVALCGLRLGGTLAALAAECIASVDALVLLAPIVSGRAYVRELRALGRMSQVPLEAIATGDVVESAGYRLHPAAAWEVARLDLRQLGFTPPHVLLLQAERGRDANLATRLAALGGAVAEAPFAGHDGFVRDALLSQAPVAEAAAIVAWLHALPPPPPGTPGVATCCRIELDVATEEPVRFGPGGALFGMMCRPRHPDPSRPAVIILNTGANHHVGNARMAVTLARRLARDGVTSLRMDAGGVGDSVLRQGGPSLALYSDASVADTLHAVAWLEGAGHGGCLVVGLCAGAWVGLHAALAERRIVGLAAINLQRFIWRPHMSLQVALRTQKRSTATYIAALRDPASWRQLLRGEVDLLGIFRILGRRLLYRLGAQLSGAISGLLGGESALHQVRRWMRELAERNVKVLMLYSDEDPGIDELETFFGPGGQRLRRLANVELGVVGQADHSLNAYPARALVMHHLEQFVLGCTLPVARRAPVARRGEVAERPRAAPPAGAMRV